MDNEDFVSLRRYSNAFISLCHKCDCMVSILFGMQHKGRGFVRISPRLLK